MTLPINAFIPLPFRFDSYGSPSMGPDVSSRALDVPATRENSHLPQAEELLKRGDFSAVLQSKDLFTALFYKFAAANKRNDEQFEVLAGGRTIQGEAHILEDVKSAVETIRRLALQSLSEKRNLTLLPIQLGTYCFLRERKSDEPVDLSDWLVDQRGRINGLTFDQNVRPCIAPLMTSLGAKCSDSEVKQVVKSGHTADIFDTQARTITAIQIDWNKEPQAGAASAS